MMSVAPNEVAISVPARAILSMLLPIMLCILFICDGESIRRDGCDLVTFGVPKRNRYVTKSFYNFADKQKKEFTK